MRIDNRINAETPKEKPMRKCLDVSGNQITLVIWDAPPEVALPEMEATGARIYVVHRFLVQAEIVCSSFPEALARAKELVANGWSW